jgi:putative FmdB family regulatory protein
MPIFDYICRGCGEEFEALVFQDAERVACPECEGDSVDRIPVSLFSCTGVQLTKMLKMDSEERMNKGREWMKRQEIRRKRIKIM